MSVSMVPGPQSVSEYVNDKVANGNSRGTMTLEERRMKMRAGVAHVKGSASPRPHRSLSRYNSFSSVDRPSTSFEDNRSLFYKRADRWDTDTEGLDDSTVDGLDYQQPRLPNYNDFARSPAPDESTTEASSTTTDDEDKYSVTASIRTEPITSSNLHPIQSLNGAMHATGRGDWADATRTRVLNRAPTDSISGSNYHQKYFQQHNFRQGFTVGTAITTIPFHTRGPHNPGLRIRDLSAPPLRSRALSPTINGHSRLNGYSTSNIPTSATIDEGGEYSGPLEMAQAREIRITHQHSMSNMSQVSSLSRTSSYSDMRAGSRTPSTTRFRTKRSRVMTRKRNRGVTQELDYSPSELANMTYQQLEAESFDENPKAKTIKTAIEFPTHVKTLEDKCEFVRSLPEKDTGGPQVEQTKTPQEVFFSTLDIDEYEEAGDHIVTQLTGMIMKIRKLRREKRKAAMAFEQEVADREHEVSTKMSNLQTELTRLRKSGQEALAAAASKV